MKEETKGLEVVTEQIWQRFEDIAADEPGPWGGALNQAHQCEANHDWRGAEAAYLRAANAVTGQPMLLAYTYDGLAALYDLLERHDEARAAARSASEAARTGSAPPLASLAILGEASLHLKARDLDSAHRMIDEALALVGGEDLADLQRAQALVLRAACFLAAERVPEARLALAESWNLLAPHANVSGLAGRQNALAKWWAASAHSRTAEGDLPGAVQAWREAVSRRRLVALAPQVEGPYTWNSLAIALCDLGMALRAVGDEVGAGEALQESRSIRAAIGVPPLDET
jgi:hypothetical protein